MVQFDNQYKQIKVKIVFYGPALGGKTTCLQHIHRVTDPQRRTRLYSLNTSSDRTLFFDLLSLNLGRIRGYRLAIQLYTVPGQVQYNATRRAVLAGADGVVFVADSQKDQRDANGQSLDNLGENFEANGIDPTTVPIVFLYNKRDLEDLCSVEVMESDLNRREVPFFPSVAISGEGVMEGFSAITETTLVAVADRLGIDPTGNAVERLRQQVRLALQPLTSVSEPRSVADDIETTVPDPELDDAGPLPQEALVSEAVRANLAMTDVSARLDTVSRELERKASVTAAIAEFGRSIANEGDPADVLRKLLKTAVKQLRAQAAAVLIVPAEGELREAVVHGLERDPLLATPLSGTSLAANVVGACEPVLVARDLEGGDGAPVQAAVEGAGFSSAIAVPLMAQDRPLGMLAVYRGSDRGLFDEDELELATILGATAAMGYANVLAFRQLEEANTGLESTVAQRSDELKTTLDEVRRLNRDLETMNGIKNELINRMAGRLEAPVASLVTATQVLERLGDAPPEKAARFLDIIRTEAQTLEEIIESVVQASFLVAGSDGVARQESPLQELLRNAVSPLGDLAKKLEVEIKVLVPSGLEALSCDADGVATALRAVIKNAIEFSPRGGEVRLEVHRVRRDQEPWVEFKVTDTGEGIPEADLARVFEAFWQGPPGRSGKHRGIGLGLMIAKQVAERHGGTMTMAVRSPDGTEVVLAIPQ